MPAPEAPASEVVAEPEPAAEATGTEALRAMVEAAVEARVAEVVAEAEERGRLRGRNEMAERRMAEPGMWEGPRDDSASAPADYDGEFLRFIRPSVWED